MRTIVIVSATASLLTASAAFAAPPPAAEQAAIYKAAGFTKKAGKWHSECGLEDTALSATPGAIEEYRDINGDGRPDALVTEGGTFCYGNTGMGFWLLSKQATGTWKLLHSSMGIAEFLPAKGVAGWPDISVGGPGFCFPVLRFNGTAYVRNRFAYEGKPCKAPR
jgi:hypothetical protein